MEKEYLHDVTGENPVICNKWSFLLYHCAFGRCFYLMELILHSRFAFIYFYTFFAVDVVVVVGSCAPQKSNP